MCNFNTYIYCRHALHMVSKLDDESTKDNDKIEIKY